MNSKHDSGTTEKPAMVTFYKSSCSLSLISDIEMQEQEDTNGQTVEGMDREQVDT